MGDDILKRLNAEISRHLRSSAWANRCVKCVMIAGGAAVAGAAQFWDFKSGGPTSSQIVGIAATLAVFLGGLYIIFIENNAAEELEAARAALEGARDAEHEYRSAVAQYSAYIDDMNRVQSLYLSMQLMRSALERINYVSVTAEGIAQSLIKAAQPYLAQALGFDTRHQWTIGIYKVKTGVNGEQVLSLVDKLRAVECDITAAREWPATSGFMGAAFTRRKEILIENANDPSLQSIFAPTDGRGRPHDAGRYVSYAIVPILVGKDDAPWGIAIATNDRVGHFSPDEEPGVHPAEGIRALAGMMALGATFAKGAKLTPSRGVEADVTQPA